MSVSANCQIVSSMKILAREHLTRCLASAEEAAIIPRQVNMDPSLFVVLRDSALKSPCLGSGLMIVFIYLFHFKKRKTLRGQRKRDVLFGCFASARNNLENKNSDSEERHFNLYCKCTLRWLCCGIERIANVLTQVNTIIL